MKRILQINVFYNYRSTGRIVRDIHEELIKNNKYDSYVIYGRIKTEQSDKIYKNNTEFYAKLMNFWSRITGVIYGQCMIGTHKLIRLIKKIKPDLVHLHCPNGYFCNIPKLLTFLNKNKYPLLLTQHCEFFYTGNCGYAFDCDKWKIGHDGCKECPQLKTATNSILFDRTSYSFKRMRNAFSNYDRLYVNSCTPWLNERANESIILSKYPKFVTYNGTDTKIFKFHDTQEDIKKKHKIPQNNKIILFVCAVPEEPIKGFKYFLEIANRARSENRDYTFIFVGGDGKSYYGSNIINIGPVNISKDLASYYSSSDLSLILSKNECFPMTIAESVCCGTKVLGFKCHGPDKAYDSNLAELVEYGNTELIYSKIVSFLESDDSFGKFRRSQEAREMLSREKMCKNYISLYDQILKD